MKQKGFTLIELMIVVTMIGILASVAMPSYQGYIYQAQTTEATHISSTLRQRITEYYRHHLAFPYTNSEAGLPQKEQLIGNYVSQIDVVDGAIHIRLGNKVAAPLQGTVITYRPATVDGSPTSPIAWLCGYDEPVKGMSAQGENRTDVDGVYLSQACRAPK
ncbi:pilin [Thaumasiovibrio subtropicus]|uniref:pilin n=1 Tax=Thaumasiovibrio subtropicus TaxID=1891207 RepID=UPI000B352CE3|nr:pilin [Thaumasiovibrio subtropicus]